MSVVPMPEGVVLRSNAQRGRFVVCLCHKQVGVVASTARLAALLRLQLRSRLLPIELQGGDYGHTALSRHSPDGRRFKVYSETASGFWQA